MELLLKLLLIVLDVLVAVVEEIAAGNTGYGHSTPPTERFVPLHCRRVAR